MLDGKVGLLLVMRTERQSFSTIDNHNYQHTRTQNNRIAQIRNIYRSYLKNRFILANNGKYF